MQRLLSFKILSKPLKNLPTGSPFLQSNVTKSFTSLPQNNPSNLPNSFFQIHSLSRLSSHTFRTWQSHNVSSQTFCGIFKNPIFGNKKISNTYLLIRSRSFSTRSIQLIRAQFLRRRFDGRWINLSGNYRRSWIPTVDGVVWGLIAANIVVFVLWRTAHPIFMLKNFTISLDNFTSGRIHTLVTSAFSHMEAGHLMSNMFGLYFFGTSIGNLFGPQFLLKLYLAGAITGSIFFLVHKAYVSSSSKLWGTNSKRGLGASGAVNAVILLDIFLFPKATHYVNFFIPVPAILLGAFLIGSDLLRIMETNSQISGAAHMGGAVVAALAWARIRKGWI